jgi:hypothetical protein
MPSEILKKIFSKLLHNHGYTYLDLVIGGVNLGDHSQEWYSIESGRGPMLEVDP